MPDRQQLLASYLNDHLAGASAGRDLFRRTARSHQGSARGPELAMLAREVDEDRDAQLDIMRAVGVSPSRPRAVLGRVAETVGRLKPNGTLLRRSPLTNVVEIEALRVAVAGKAAGWDVLLTLAADEPRLPRERLEELRARAQDQGARLRELHQQAAREGLTR